MYSDDVTNTNRKMSKFSERSLSDDVHIKEEMPVGLRSSPDSSTDPWGCPQCGQGAENESRLLEHLLHEHKIRVVPPQSPTKTRCPVCRKHVADLSHHFALEHGDQQQSQEVTPQGLLSGGGASVTRIIPIVLPSQPASRTSQSLLSDDSEAHLLESVNPKPGQQISPFNGGDNYKSNGGSTRSSTPNSIINDNPVNLSMRREFQQPNTEDQSIETNSSDGSSGLYIAGSESGSDLGRKRRKQTHVPDNNKDERYWARRLKNNEAAKKSRDMRIKREKVIFEENVRLENMVKDLQRDNDGYCTENKELHLKLGIILDENARLKALLQERN